MGNFVKQLTAAFASLGIFFGAVAGIGCYLVNGCRAPLPDGLMQGEFAPMPALGTVDFTVPTQGSLEQVRDEIRRARAEGDSRHFTVLIEDGEYSLSGIEFDARDYDTTYRSKDGGAVFSGGQVLAAHDFSPVSGDAAERLCKKAQKHTVQIDLTALGLTSEDWGKLYSNSSIAQKYENAIGPQGCELFFNGSRCRLAQWPNGDAWLKTGQVLDNGDFMEDSGGWPVTPEEQARWAALQNPRGGTFLMDKKTAKRAAAWQEPQQAWMIGMFNYDWAETVTPLLSINKDTGAATTAYASVYGFREDRDYRFYNILEELDEPGEWYLDRETGMLYLWPPEGELSSARAEISLHCDTLLRGEGLRNISFIGLTFQSTRGGGIALEGGNITIDHCTVRNTAGDAITLEGSGNTIKDCEVSHVGRMGITLRGGDLETLTPGGSRVVNSLVHDWSELALTYQGGINIYGSGNIAAHNELYNAPHSAFLFGGNNTMEYNLIHDVCLETSDAGAFYTGGLADNYGTVIRGNLIYNLGRHGTAKKTEHNPSGIYLDEMTSGVTVENNLLINIPHCGLPLGGGRELTIRGNVVVNAGRPISYDDRARQGALFGGWNPTALENGSYWQSLWASPWQSEAWQAAFPRLYALSADFSQPDDPNFGPNPAFSEVTGNAFAGRGKASYAESVLRFSTVEQNNERGFLYSLQYWKLPEYAGIELEKIGRVS